MDATAGLIALTDDDRALRDEARRFAAEEITPVAAKYDESSEFPRSILKKSQELGLMNLLLDSSLGGTGLSTFQACLIIEELAAAGDEHQQTATGGVILRVRLEVLGKLVDPAGQHRDLHVGTPCVLIVHAERLNILSLCHI